MFSHTTIPIKIIIIGNDKNGTQIWTVSQMLSYRMDQHHRCHR